MNDVPTGTTGDRPRADAREQRSSRFGVWRRVDGGVAVHDLTYEVLAWLAAGHSVFRPREATQEAEEAFREVVTLLGRLRERELVDYREGHITRTEAGIYLAVGPVQLTQTGEVALKRDQRLGARPPADGPLPWRT